jgi:cytochrome d ubiquinol oxidase subunit I
MNIFSDTVMLSRLQFALTIMFHIIWPVATIGLSLFLVFLESCWVITLKENYYRHARFWSRLFFLIVAVGVVTGIPMEFQFGTNWSIFARTGGDFFGHILGYEAAMAFMLEAGFIGIMAFGWKHVSPGVHLFATSMVAFGASLSAFWIMVANSWMQTARGGFFNKEKFVVTSHLQAIFNPDMMWSVPHMWVAALEISIFIVGGISAWYLYKYRHSHFFLSSFKWAAAVAVLIAPLQIWLGDGSARSAYKYDPAKFAAMESHWNTNPPDSGASFSIVAWPDQQNQNNRWSIEIPDFLSILTTRSITGSIKGLRDFRRENQPPVALTYWSFRVMVAAGTALVLLALWTIFVWRRGGLDITRFSLHKGLLLAWIAAIPLSYIALEAGWITREVGRQPWVIHNLLKTADSASRIPAKAVLTSLTALTLVYALLMLLFCLFAWKIIKQGPEMKLDDNKSRQSG